jgi:hypothetical protein
MAHCSKQKWTQQSAGEGGLLEAVLRAHLGAVEAGVDPLALPPREEPDPHVERPAGAAGRRPAVHDLRHQPERHARADARQAAVAAVLHAVEQPRRPGGHRRRGARPRRRGQKWCWLSLRGVHGMRRQEGHANVFLRPRTWWRG